MASFDSPDDDGSDAVRKYILRLAAMRFGPAGEAMTVRLSRRMQRVNDNDLRALLDRVLTTASWDELLADD